MDTRGRSFLQKHHFIIALCELFRRFHTTFPLLRVSFTLLAPLSPPKVYGRCLEAIDIGNNLSVVLLSQGHPHLFPFSLLVAKAGLPDFIVAMAFGDFEWLCQLTPFPICSLVGPTSSITGNTGIDTLCYARSVEVANTIIFEAASDFAHILALIMTAVMIIHVRSKFTAVGQCLQVKSAIVVWRCLY